MIILGLNTFHGDFAAAIVRDGKLVAAAEEERFRRDKALGRASHLEAIAYCLREAALRFPMFNMSRSIKTAGQICSGKFVYLAMQRPNIGLVIDRLKNRNVRAGNCRYVGAKASWRAFRTVRCITLNII